MRRSKDFRRTTRRGLRVARTTLIFHAVPAPDGPRIGFVVSGALGNAVTRNRVKRRLRHLAMAHVADTPAGIDVVVRALPRAATDPADVPPDFGSAWHEMVSRLATRRPEQNGGVR